LLLLLFASPSSFHTAHDDDKKQEEEVVLVKRLPDVVEDEVRCPEPPAGAFNISFFLKRAKEKNGGVYHIQQSTDISPRNPCFFFARPPHIKK